MVYCIYRIIESIVTSLRPGLKDLACLYIKDWTPIITVAKLFCNIINSRKSQIPYKTQNAVIYMNITSSVYRLVVFKPD